MDSDAAHNAKRARSFGAVAQLYDRARPGYPAELFADLAGLLTGPSVLEVGAGTGKATMSLTAHGLAVTCIEPDPYMAAVLADRTISGPRVRIEVATFESFGTTETFDGLFSAQAWHWTDPATRLDRAAALLRPGGVLGLCWNHASVRRPEIYEAIQRIYDEFELSERDRPRDPGSAAGEDPVPSQAPANPHAAQLLVHPEFEYLGMNLYPWQRDYTAAEFCAFEESTSHYQVLDAKVRERLLTAVATLIREQYDDLIALEWLTKFYTARRRA